RQANPSLPTPLISWNDSGQRFVVHDSAEFSRSILPKYFKHNNWQSFNRQLNLYRFRKTNNLQHARTGQRGCLIWEFSHPFFKRGGKAQLFKVRRK
ncbi:winged helix DNA-binding domain-containing protein, partial [Violaceomyces palustris]